MRSTLRPAIGTSRVRRKRHAISAAAFEVLEQRRMFSVSATFATGVLTVNGDDNANAITVSRDLAGTLLVNGGAVTINGGIATVANTTSLTINGAGGNDTLTLDETNGALPAGTIDGGAGIDTVAINGSNQAETYSANSLGTHVLLQQLDPATFTIDITGSEQIQVNLNGGDDSFFGGAGLATLASFSIDGGTGGDTIIGTDGNDFLVGGDDGDFIDGNAGNDLALLGAGDDVFRWDPGDGSDVVEGQAGIDLMAFNGAANSEMFDLSAKGRRLQLTRNLGTIVMDVGGVEQVDVNARNGQDTITVNDLSGTDVTDVELNLEPTVGIGSGDLLLDKVVVNATADADSVQIAGSDSSYVVVGLSASIAVSGSEGDKDILVLRTLGAADAVNASALQANVALLTIENSSGNDTLVGSQGDDIIFGGVDRDLIVGKQGTDVAFLGAGDDTFLWESGDGNDSFDGESGNDRLFFNGAIVADHIDVSASGSHGRVVDDVGNVTIDLVNAEEILLVPLDGADTVNVNDLRGTDITEVNVDLQAAAFGVGDNLVDTIIVNGTAGNDAIQISDSPTAITSVRGLFAAVAVKHAEAALDRVQVNTLGGADTISVDQTGPNGAIRQIVMDGGADHDVITVIETIPDGAVTLLPSTGDDSVNVNSDSDGKALVIFGATQNLGSVTINNGGLASLPAGADKVLAVSSLNINGSGKLDLNDNDLILDYTGATQLAAIQALINAARSGGTWTGNGLTSTSAKIANPRNTTLGAMEATDFKSINGPAALFDNQAIDNSAILVKYTYYGDTDFNGVVDFDDYSRIDAGFNNNRTGWLNGDVDGNGIIDFDDYSLIDQAFNTQGSALRPAPARLATIKR